MSTQRPPTITDQMRQLLRGADAPMREIARGAGVDNTALSRFLNSERGLSCETMDALGLYFGWQVITSQSKPRRKAR
ncbi:MAG TPA: hypothetical protein VHZ24_00580 [Pirellulales bacterium]|nr:hypothetical protein [Pirellulales bacterium]